MIILPARQLSNCVFLYMLCRSKELFIYIKKVVKSKTLSIISNHFMLLQIQHLHVIIQEKQRLYEAFCGYDYGFFLCVCVQFSSTFSSASYLCFSSSPSPCSSTSQMSWDSVLFPGRTGAWRWLEGGEDLGCMRTRCLGFHEAGEG